MKIIRYIFIRHFYHISFIFNLTNHYFRSTDPLPVGRIDLFRYSNEVSPQSNTEFHGVLFSDFKSIKLCETLCYSVVN